MEADKPIEVEIRLRERATETMASRVAAILQHDVDVECVPACGLAMRALFALSKGNFLQARQLLERAERERNNA